jgi:seryl-tRNA synthetase
MPTLVPDVCKVEMIEACGFNPRGPESQVYTIHENNNDNKNYLGLIGTAEIPLAGLALNQTFETNELPFRTVGFSHAFRREAGSRGAQSKGLYRLHQFSKVEMFIHCTHNQADNELQNMIDIQCDLLNQLGLHGRVLQMPTEELGASAHRKLDVEVWMPGRNEYGEVCSASDCTDYQSRRLNTQYIDRSEKSKKKQFVSTLNATAMAIPRVMLAILETHQVEDGTVKVPAPMIPFIGKDTIGVVEEQN